MPQQITEQNVGAFKTIFDNYQSNPGFFENHERSAEFLNAVSLYGDFLEQQKTSQVLPTKTVSPLNPVADQIVKEAISPETVSILEAANPPDVQPQEDQSIVQRALSVIKEKIDISPEQETRFGELVQGFGLKPFDEKFQEAVAKTPETDPLREASVEAVRRLKKVNLQTFNEIQKALPVQSPQVLLGESNDNFIEAFEPLLEVLNPKAEESLGKRLSKEVALLAILPPIIMGSILDDPVETTKGIGNFFLTTFNNWMEAVRQPTDPLFDPIKTSEARDEIIKSPLFHTLPLLGVGGAFKAKISKLSPKNAKTLSSEIAKDVVKEVQKNPELSKQFEAFPEDISITSKARAEQVLKKTESERQATLSEPKTAEISRQKTIPEDIKEISPLAETTKEAPFAPKPIETPKIAEKPKKPKIAPKQEEVATEEKLALSDAEPKQVATVEALEETRKKFGLAKLPLDETIKWVDVFKKAENRKTESAPIVKSLQKKARVLTNEEFAVLALRQKDVESIINKSQSELSKAVDKGNVKEQSRQTTIMDGALAELSEITEAMRFSNREAGRALNIIKIALRKEGEQYKVAKVLQLAKVAKGEKLTNAETVKLGNLSRKIEVLKERETTLTKEIESLQEALSKQDATSNFRKTIRTIPRERSQTALKTERAELFTSLNKLGFRLNDVVGLTYESATLVNKLAINYFKSGIKGIDAIVEKIQNKVPDLSNKDIYDSIGGRIKKTKKQVVSETQQEIRELKTQAKLLGQIEDAYSGVFDKIQKKEKPSAQVSQLQSRLRELKKRATKTSRDTETLNKILMKIDIVQNQLSAGIREIKKTKKIESVDIQNARQELSELRRLMTSKDKIADLENQLKTGDFKVPVKIQRVIKNTDLVETQVKLSQLRREVREAIHSMKPRTKRELFIDVITTPRTLLATADLSGVLRQGLGLSIRHPVAAAKAFVQSTKAFFSKHTADEIDVAIRKHENQPIREQSGLFIASLDKIDFTKREEAFVSNLAEKIPVWGEVVKASNRNMVSHLNLLRTKAFDHFLNLYPNATTTELKAWANYVNISSGRGNLGSFNKVANELSIVVFSPRFSMSRIQLPFEILRNWKHPNVRKEIAKHTLAHISFLGMALYLAELGGAEVGKNPESSDFLKIRIDDTRVDILGGLQQPTRVMLLAMLKTLETGNVIDMEKNIDLFDAVGTFAKYKLAPSITIPTELVQGEDAVGNIVNPLDTFIKNVTPLAMQDIIDASKSSPELAAVLAPFLLLGISTSTFTVRVEENWKTKDTKELRKFKNKIGKKRFSQANKDFNQRMVAWLEDESKTTSWQNMTDDERKKEATKQKKKVRRDIRRKYR